MVGSREWWGSRGGGGQGWQSRVGGGLEMVGVQV